MRSMEEKLQRQQEKLEEKKRKLLEKEEQKKQRQHEKELKRQNKKSRAKAKTIFAHSVSAQADQDREAAYRQSDNGLTEAVKVSDRKKYRRYVLFKRVRRGLLWGLFVLAFIFAIWKNFTAINRHTITEKETVREVYTSSIGVEQLAKDFATVYFSWGEDAKRNEKLDDMVLDRLQGDSRMIAPVKLSKISKVTDVTIEDVTEQEKDDAGAEYEVLFSVKQLLFAPGEQDQSKMESMTHWYRIGVFVDKNKDMVVDRLPVPAKKAGKATKKEMPHEYVEVDMKDKKDIDQFLKDFFSIYLTAEPQALKYYAEGVLPFADKRDDLEFLEANNVEFLSFDEDQAKLVVKITYANKKTETQEVFSYQLTLVKKDTWKIEKMD